MDLRNPWVSTTTSLTYIKNLVKYNLFSLTHCRQRWAVADFVADLRISATKELGTQASSPQTINLSPQLWFFRCGLRTF